MRRLFRKAASIATAVFLVTGLLATAAFADETNTNTIIQDASNTAAATQAVAAVSGDAAAVDDSSAGSGDATAIAEALQAQANIQVGANQVVVGEAFPTAEGDSVNDNWVEQAAANAAGTDQGAAAVSGIATAEDSSESWTGAATGAAASLQEQINVQVGVNQALVDLSALMGGLEGATPQE